MDVAAEQDRAVHVELHDELRAIVDALFVAAARSEEAVADMHMRHALGFVEILGNEADPSRAVSLYADRLDLPDIRARLVYQRVMAQLADKLLPRLHEAVRPEDGAGTEDANSA